MGQALVACCILISETFRVSVAFYVESRAQARTSRAENTWVVTGGPWAHPEVGCAWGRWWAVNWSTWSSTGMGCPYSPFVFCPSCPLSYNVIQCFPQSEVDSPVKQLKVVKHEIALSHLVRKFFPFQFSALNIADFFRVGFQVGAKSDFNTF